MPPCPWGFGEKKIYYYAVHGWAFCYKSYGIPKCIQFHVRSSSKIMCICFFSLLCVVSRFSGNVLFKYMVYFILLRNTNVWIYVIQCRSMQLGICVLFARKRCMPQSCYGVNTYSVKTVYLNGMFAAPCCPFLFVSLTVIIPIISSYYFVYWCLLSDKKWSMVVLCCLYPAFLLCCLSTLNQTL